MAAPLPCRSIDGASRVSERMTITLRMCAMLVLWCLNAAFASVGAEESSDNAPAPASAVELHTVIGFANVFRLGRWAPVAVAIENRGNDIVGDVEVIVTHANARDGSLTSVTHRRSLELTRDARKRFRFTVRPDTLSQPIVVRVTAGGSEVGRESIDLRNRFTVARVILVVSRDANLDYLNEPEHVRVLYPHPELLPVQWQGYDGVAAIVLHGVSLESMSAHQFDALGKWLARGGRLIVSGGPHYALLRSPRLASLLPAVPEGMVSIDDVSVMYDALGMVLSGRAPIYVNRLGQLRGRVTNRAGAAPLVVERTVGWGRVVYVTFDIARAPFVGGAAMNRFWLDILRLPVEVPLGARLDIPPKPKRPALPEMVRELPLNRPGYGALFTFAALYLGVLATGYRLQRVGPVGRWLVPSMTLAAPLLFVPIAYLIFGPRVYPAGAAAVAISVIEPIPASPYASLRVALGVYSRSSDAWQFEYEGAQPSFGPPEQTYLGEPGSNWVFREGVGLSIEPTIHREYLLHELVGEDVVTFEIDAHLEETPAGAVLHLRNDSGRALLEAWVVRGMTAYPLGTVAEGASIERALDDLPGAVAIGGDEDLFRLVAQRPSPALHYPLAARYALEKTLAAHRESGDNLAAGALLLGVSKSPFRPSGASAAWAWTGLTLIHARLPSTPRASPLAGRT